MLTGPIWFPVTDEISKNLETIALACNGVLFCRGR